MLTDSDLQAIWLTAKLASIVTLILLVIGTPIAWRLSRTKAWWKGPVSAIVAMPLVLPPSVIGFYLLISMGPNGIIGQLTESLGLGRLPFTFWGLVIASTVHSMPFMIQPLQTAFDAVGERLAEVVCQLRIDLRRIAPADKGLDTQGFGDEIRRDPQRLVDAEQASRNNAEDQRAERPGQRLPGHPRTDQTEPGSDQRELAPFGMDTGPAP